MIETTKDVLFLVIAGAIIILTFFFAWALYYIVMMLKRMNEVVNDVREFMASLKDQLKRLEALFLSIEEKIKHSATYLPLVMKGITDLFEFFKKRKEKKQSVQNQKKARS